MKNISHLFGRSKEEELPAEIIEYRRAVCVLMGYVFERMATLGIENTEHALQLLEEQEKAN